MKLSRLLQDVPALAMLAEPETEIGDICYDSRQVKPGDVFVAIKGEKSDGHDYISAAVSGGAVCVVCEKQLSGSVPAVLVSDSRYALAIMSRNYFGNPAAAMKIIGVTGTNGKTTATTLLKSVLEKTIGAKVGLVGTNQNMIQSRVLEAERTTPESYELHKLFAEMRQDGCDYVVMEVSSHALAMDRVAGIEFEIGAFTNLTQDHLDFHGDMETYGAAKAKLFTMSKHGAVNLDDPAAAMMMAAPGCEYLTYGTKNNAADLLAKDIRLSSSGVRFAALNEGRLQLLTMPIPGRFSVYNALTVLSCALLLGVPLGEACAALEGVSGVKGRMEVVPTPGSDYTILIDYAHTPDAIENVLKSLREVVTEGRVVLLFGCGGDRDKDKRAKMGAAAAKYADYTIVTTDNPRTEQPEAIIAQILQGISGTRALHKVIPDREEAIAWAMDHHLPGDVLVLAGKGHETYQEVGTEKRHMDEREIVAAHLGKT